MLFPAWTLKLEFKSYNINFGTFPLQPSASCSLHQDSHTASTYIFRHPSAFPYERLRRKLLKIRWSNKSKMPWSLRPTPWHALPLYEKIRNQHWETCSTRIMPNPTRISAKHDTCHDKSKVKDLSTVAIPSHPVPVRPKVHPKGNDELAQNPAPEIRGKRQIWKWNIWPGKLNIASRYSQSEILQVYGMTILLWL